jgi:uncharacterized membrane protein YeaQ/YmgE (transglycosylase-associated protein family)
MTLKGFSCEGLDRGRESDAEDLMSGVGVFATAVIGILAGWIADLALGRRHSLFVKLLIGVIGSFIGVFIARASTCRSPASGAGCWSPASAPSCSWPCSASSSGDPRERAPYSREIA